MNVLLTGLFLRYALIWIQAIAVGIGMNLAMKSRFRGWKKYLIFPIMDICVAIFADQVLNGYNYLQMVMGTGAVILYGVYFHHDIISRKLFYSICSVLLGVMIEYSLIFCIMYLGLGDGDPVAFAKSPEISNILTFYATLLYVILNISLGWFWRIYIRETIVYSLWSFLLLPISQFLLIYCLYPTNYKNIKSIVGNVVAFILMIVADSILLIVLRHDIHRQEMEHELKEKVHQAKLEEEYYRSLENRILPIEKICHDCNNQLLIIYYLMERGEWGKAKILANELEEQLSLSMEGKT